MTDTLQFYPTPPALKERLYSKFQQPLRAVLEPHAGNGDLLPSKFDRNHVVDVLEIDPYRAEKLKGRYNIRFVGYDFLNYRTGKSYSHIVMNPPFKNGVDHVLHGWGLLKNGELGAILNAETIRNPYSEKRQHLARLIERFGSVEFVTDAFSDPDTGRKAEVEVALVYLRKQGDASVDFSFLLDGMKKDKSPVIATGTEIAMPRKQVDDLVLAFHAAVEAMKQSCKAEAQATYYASLIGSDGFQSLVDGIADDGEVITKSLGFAELDKVVNDRYEELKRAAWGEVFKGVRPLLGGLASSVQDEICGLQEQTAEMEFSHENINQFLHTLIQSMETLQIESVCSVFDLICRYHPKNAFFYRGWKSNEKHRLGQKVRPTRFILPNMKAGWSGKDFGYEMERKLIEIDKVFAFLDGKRFGQSSLLNSGKANLDFLVGGGRLETEYFDIRWYPSSATMHFFPTNKQTIERMNLLVGKHRQWLPENPDQAPEAFWEQYSDKVAAKVTARMMENGLSAYYFNYSQDRTIELLRKAQEFVGIDWSKLDYTPACIESTA